MDKIKRIFVIGFAIFILNMLFSWTVPADASEIAVIENGKVNANAAYETGKTYSINGIDYSIETNGTVTVKGTSLCNGSERVEILSEIGGYPVTTIGVGAFYKCKSVKEVIVPETVKLIDRTAFEKSGLIDMEIRGKNVHIKTDFYGTPMLHESEEHWSNDVFIVSGYAVRSYARGDVVFGENIVGISEDCFRYSGGSISKFTVLNPDCYIPDVSGALPPNAVNYGYKESTVHKYAEKYDCRFLLICNCEDTEFKPATSSRCDGTVGYGEGYWCDSCKLYVSGGIVDTTFEHIDSDGDNICDLCSLGTDAEITTAGQCGDEAVWTLSADGVLRITGTSSVYAYSTTNKEPWYAYKDDIKAFVAEKGVRGLSGISFKDYQKLETAYMADTVLYLPQSFENCTALKYFNIPKLVRGIGDFCFRKCTSLESVFIPKNVTVIDIYAFYKCTNLSNIDFETGYLSIGRSAFYGTAAYNNPDNIKDGFLYIDNCLIAEITSGADTLVLDSEITSVASGWEATDSKVTEVVVYNYDCAFPNDTGALPGGTHFKGYVGSTAWFYSKKDFVPLEPHTHTELIDIPAVVPTSTEPGYTHLSHCAVCGEIVSKRQIVEYVEYDIFFDNDKVIAQKSDAATTGADGSLETITFIVRNNVLTSNITQTVIYKVGEVRLSKTEFTYNGKEQKPTVSVKDSKGNYLVMDKDYEVIYPSSSKYSGIYTVKINYIGNYAGNETLNYNIVINPVTPIVSEIKEDSITLSWVKGHSDLYYRIYFVDLNGSLKKIADTKYNSYVITSLDPDVVYTFVIRAYVKDNNGKLYWGEEGDEITCVTNVEDSNNNILDFLKIIFDRFKHILKMFFIIK